MHRTPIAIRALSCWLVAGACAVGFALTSSACTKSADGAAPPPKNRLTIGVTQEPDTLLMQLQQMYVSEHIGRPGALLLTVYDDRWQLQPFVAAQVLSLIHI